MGDIARHRDIFLNTREAIPPEVLSRAKLSLDDLTYLELGNYLTDVSQFRDPVFYIFAKQGIWRDFVLPLVDENDYVKVIRALTVLGGNAAAAGLLASGRPKNAAIPAVLGAIPGFISNDLLAGIFGADDWIDRMFGTPFERVGSVRKRRPEEYGYVGEFFHHFIEGITHLLFAKEITNQVKGEWGKITRIPQARVSAVYKEFFTQYYPHEHTDQPPYVWDASDRDRHPELYGPSKRQRSLQNAGGIMNVVDKDYIQYLSEGLSQLENEWRLIKPDAGDAPEARHKCLVRLGKLLHGIEDWYFHSNVVELLHLRGHKPAQAETEDGEKFVQRFVREELEQEAVFRSAETLERVGLQRRLYRRLRYPVYKPGNRINTGGIASKEKSVLRLDLAYPAFPSQLDTTHTLLGALEALEFKIKGAHPGTNLTETLGWAPCALERYRSDPAGRARVAEKMSARGVTETDFALAIAEWNSTGRFPQGQVGATILDVLREWLPLVATLLSERERQRLVRNVEPLAWPVGGPIPPLPKSRPPGAPPLANQQLDKQLERHKLALKPRANPASRTENNYEQAARYLDECGFLNGPGRSALEQAFKIDLKSENLHNKAPGSGGVLIQFAVKLQRMLDEGDEMTAQLNVNGQIFQEASDNGAFTEVVGSHSLMSKDTVDAAPFFDDARVLATVASQTVLHILLDEVSTPASDTGLNWPKILQHLIRFPPAAEEWERNAIAFFRDPGNNGKMPKLANLPELVQLKSSRLPIAQLEPLRKGKKARELEEMYVKVESKVSKYRYPSR